jgi:cation diffusion facilitator CzcD-associated flavoprotein CzcO
MTELPQKVDIVVVGTGFAGVCMGIQLLKNGFTDFIILERSNDVGGTWRDNTYPGAACDVHSPLYSFSFEPNPNWSRMFANHREIYDYTWHCVRKYGLEKHIRFGKSILGGDYDAANAEWTINMADGTSLKCNKWINGMGPLNRPVFPNLEGISEFKGAHFHSSEWRHDVNLKGKRVAVVGTGASAVQIVPNIADTVSELHLFQRTPAWVIAKPDREMTRLEKWVFKRIPFIQKLYRWRIYWQNELTVNLLVFNPKYTKLIAGLGKRQLRKGIKDPALREKLTPAYSPGCKRILPSNNFYPTLERKHVHLHTEGIERITANGLLGKDGHETKVDAVIYATGFEAADFPAWFNVKGKDGRQLLDVWKDGPEAYLGTVVSGFPNMFMLIGPNTGLGHTSMIIMIEASVNYTIECLKVMQRNKAKGMDVKPDVQQAYNEDIQRKLATTVWATGGCKSWYISKTGKNTSVWPGFTFTYMKQTNQVKEEDFSFN